MNIRPLLSEAGYEPYDGEVGLIDYKLIELGKHLKETYANIIAQVEGRKEGTLELIFCEYTSDEQVWVYSFSGDGFSFKRWIKKNPSKIKGVCNEEAEAKLRGK